MTGLSKLAALVAGMSNPPWWSDAMNVENSHVIITRCSSGLVDTDLVTVTANADGIAALRNCAEELIKVAEAARVHVRAGGMRNAQALSDAIAALDAKLEGL